MSKNYASAADRAIVESNHEKPRRMGRTLSVPKLGHELSLNTLFSRIVGHCRLEGLSRLLGHPAEGLENRRACP